MPCENGDSADNSVPLIRCASNCVGYGGCSALQPFEDQGKD